MAFGRMGAIGGYGSLGRSSGGVSGGITLPKDPVLIINGDSQAQGTAPDAEIAAFKASYVVTSKIKVLTFAGTWVNYDPNSGFAGINPGANSGNPGMEIGYIRRFLEDKYTNTLWIAKVGRPGAYQGRFLPTTGNITASIAGNTLSVTAGTGGGNSLIVGSGVPDGTYIMFGTFVGKAGQATNVNYTVPSTVMAKYNFTESWSVTEGGLYLGHSGNLALGHRAIVLAGLAALTSASVNWQIATYMVILGTNDMSSTTGGAVYQAHSTDFHTRIASDFDLSKAQIVVPRVGTGATDSATVRTAQAAVKALDPTRRKLIEMDFQARPGGTHWDLAGLDYGGAQAFDMTFGTATGL